jgi:hydroxyethylthiazole kinase-like uncharacterized protein yjeF
MKILSAEQIRAWDQYTIQQEPVASIDLMERAAAKCVEWLEKNHYSGKNFVLFCGKGNNGGDGLALARMLRDKDNEILVYITETGNKGTDDYETNLHRLQNTANAAIHFIKSEPDFPVLKPGSVIIDALFGSGLTRPLEGMISKLVKTINHSGCEIIAVDMPSGLFTDKSSKSHTVINASHTLSFQCYKPAFLVAENAAAMGTVHILDIGLKKDFPATAESKMELVDGELIRSIYKPRNLFAHKGNFGHALFIAGSHGKMGAAVLAAKACLRSGVGLLTCHIPQCGYDILQTAVPEAMVNTDFNSSFITSIEYNLAGFNAAGVGPGIGTASETRRFLKNFFTAFKKPVVLDADGLNCISMEKDLLKEIPAGSILTPHPKEFERLFGESENDFERIDKALALAGLLNCLIILKGHHTFIATPSGRGYFNATGNAGMATAGSGDVLTGILTGLLAQGYAPENAAILGVYLHGLAGDIAAKKHSQEAMLAGDIIDSLGAAFLAI